jgi:hypothetical protein
MKKIIFLVLFASVFAANPVLKFYNRAVTAGETLCQSRAVFEKASEIISRNQSAIETNDELFGEYGAVRDVDCGADYNVRGVDCSVDCCANYGVQDVDCCVDCCANYSEQDVDCGAARNAICDECDDCPNCPNCPNDEKKPRKAFFESGTISETNKSLFGEREASVISETNKNLSTENGIISKTNKNLSVGNGTVSDASGAENQDAGLLEACSAKPLSSILNVYRNLNDYYIDFFERNIVKKPVVTKYSKEELDKMAEKYGVDFYKMRVMLVVEAIYEMNGTKKDLNQIKKMSVPELTKIVFEAKNKFFATLTPEEKAKFDAEHRNGKSKNVLKYSSEQNV